MGNLRPTENSGIPGTGTHRPVDPLAPGDLDRHLFRDTAKHAGGLCGAWSVHSHALHPGILDSDYRPGLSIHLFWLVVPHQICFLDGKPAEKPDDVPHPCCHSRNRTFRSPDAPGTDSNAGGAPAGLCADSLVEGLERAGRDSEACLEECDVSDHHLHRVANSFVNRGGCHFGTDVLAPGTGPSHRTIAPGTRLCHCRRCWPGGGDAGRVINLAVDLAYGILDPRIRYG